MDTMEKTIETIKKHLPPPGTGLGEYAFLPADQLWTGETNGVPFTAVAEDRWPFGGGMFLLVRKDGPVYLSDLENYNELHYCAAGFPQFVKIMELCFAAHEDMPDPSTFDEEETEEAERVLRKKAAEIDPTAIEDENGFWSVWIEEQCSGIL